MLRPRFLFLRTILAGVSLALLSLATPAARAAVDNTDPHAPIPTFNSGLHIADAFDGPLERNYAAYRGAFLNINEFAMVGLVPHPVTGATGHIGLARRSIFGGRMNWPTANSPVLVYPSASGSTFNAVPAVRRHGNYLFVLAVREFSPGDNDVHVLVFSVSGDVIANVTAFGSSANEHGAGIEVWEENGETKLGVVATRTLDGVSRPQYRRYRVQANGTLVADTLVSTYAPSACEFRSCIATSTALSTISGPAIYIGGNIVLDGNDTNYIAMAIAGDGTLYDFGANGLSVTNFDSTGSDRRDWLTRVDVRDHFTGGSWRRDVLLVGEVSRRCRASVGVVKLDGYTGQPINAFGGNTGGKVLIGGSDVTSLCGLPYNAAHLARAVIIKPDRILMVGFSVRPQLGGGELDVNGFLASLHPTTGQVHELRDHPFRAYANAKLHTGLYDLLPDPLADFPNDVYALGDARWANDPLNPPSVVGHTLFTAIGFSPDRIFGNGLQP